MGLQKLAVTLIGLCVLVPAFAVDEAATKAIIDEAEKIEPENSGSGAAMEERIKKYRETMRQRKQAATAAAEAVTPDAATGEDLPVLPATAAGEKAADSVATAPAAEKGEEAAAVEISDRQQQYREWMRQQREAREAQVRARREAREQQRKARMEAWLEQQEERQKRVISRHEAMRNQAEKEHNFLVQNHDEMLNKALQKKVDVANRHEEMRKEAEQRRKKFAAFRATVKDMSPAERREYMEEHRDELFPRSEINNPPAMPAPPPGYGGMYQRPPMPPWYR